MHILRRKHRFFLYFFLELEKGSLLLTKCICRRMNLAVYIFIPLSATPVSQACSFCIPQTKVAACFTSVCSCGITGTNVAACCLHPWPAAFVSHRQTWQPALPLPTAPVSQEQTWQPAIFPLPAALSSRGQTWQLLSIPGLQLHHHTDKRCSCCRYLACSSITTRTNVAAAINTWPAAPLPHR
jgi:hypothetical protein